MLDADEAIRRLGDPELLKLLAVVAVGWWLVTTGGTPSDPSTYPGYNQVLVEYSSTVLVFLGYVLFAAGSIALVFKIAHDAVVLAER